MANDEQNLTILTGGGDPIFAFGMFIEFHVNKHSFGLSHQNALHNYEWGGLYNDSMDENYNFIYSEGISDYTEYNFGNTFAFYRYSFIIADFQPSVKIAAGYHNVVLNGYGYYSYYNSITDESNSIEWSDISSTNYWSIKPEFEFAFRFSKHFSVFGSLAYDFALGKTRSYQYNYDSQLVEAGYLNEISRSFNPPNYLELRLGAAVSF